ncbi:MAG: hypothetical protein NXI19_05775 [Alphaproteobacteria bacterium]|nr:hypothetical protein [Alphaproteobacteria bacterium]
MKAPAVAFLTLLCLTVSACGGGYRAPTDHKRQIELSDQGFASPADCQNAYMRSILNVDAPSGTCGYTP